MALKTCRAVFMRGGTSKGIVFREGDLPAGLEARNQLFLAAMGSPDPYMRQLDGMGGGVSSLSKICIVGPASRSDADVDFTFVQVEIDRAEVDYAATCGNMSSTIGPFAVDEGLVPAPADGEAAIRVHNTNTRKVYVARFPVKGGKAVVEGDLAIDGVAGTAAPVRLDYQDPGGAKTGKLLPTGNAVDMLDMPGVGRIPVSMIDAANPTVFVAARDVGMNGIELPAALERDLALMEKFEIIRRHAAVAMGMSPDLEHAGNVRSVPKLGILSPPVDQTLISGKHVAAEELDIVARMISVGQPHRATPLTSALCLAVACRIPGSIAHQLVRPGDTATPVRIGHPSGEIMVGAGIEIEGETVRVPYVTMYRTARRLFQGEVCYVVPDAGAMKAAAE
ncbi:MAG TPA: PrpF domain-containing protein [Stellaceae bacterium]|nr:PrpF domain-containing protein [Stellaceae bacterium]